MCHVFCIRLSVHGQLGCSRVLAVENGAALNLRVVCLLEQPSDQSGAAGSYGVSVSSFLRSLHTVLCGDCTNLPQQCRHV